MFVEAASGAASTRPKSAGPITSAINVGRVSDLEFTG
jgi:hypothetical protein